LLVEVVEAEAIILAVEAVLVVLELLVVFLSE
jgi:hypothetical protein